MDLFKSLAWDRLALSGFKSLLLVYPVLGWGPVLVISKWLYMKFTDYVYEELKLQTELKMIEWKNAEFDQKFHESSADLRIIALKYGSDSNEFKTAHEKFKRALDDLVSF